MNDLPPGSGLPAWAWTSYEPIATVVVIAAIASAIAGALVCVVPRGPGRHSLPHVLAVAVAIAIAAVAAWTIAAALTSVAPRGDTFCIAPTDWVAALPPTCIARRPVWLLSAPLALAVIVAIMGLALGLVRRRTRLAVAAAIAAAPLAVVTALAAAVVQPGVLEPGGLMIARDALARLALDPLRAGAGVVVGVILAILDYALARRDSRDALHQHLPR